MPGKTPVSLLAVAWLALPLAARAHDLWLEPQGENLVLRYGHRGGDLLDLDGSRVRTLLCRKGGEPMRLIQVAWEMETADTRKRELRSLAKAMTELDMKDAIIVTHEEEGETTVNGGTVRILPAWRFLLGMT